MRQHIEQCLSAFRTATDPLARTLADVEGEASPALLERLRACRPAAVLVGLIDRPGGLNVLLTQRARHLSAHAGQVSFPGGRLEPSDSGPVEAALREAGEEIGLEPALVEVIGRLDSFATVTGFVVTPVVGFVSPAFEPVPDATEVEAVFEVPLAYVLDQRNVATAYRERLGVRFRVHEIRYAERHIWGATAAILINLRDILSK